MAAATTEPAKADTKRATKTKPADEPAPAVQPAAAHKSLDMAILAVMEECPYIQKQGRMKGGGMNYTFVSEPDLIARLHPLMRKHRIVMVPAKVELLFHELYPLDSGGMSNRTCIKVAYRVTHADTSTTCMVEGIGEGCDRGDKAPMKAMTAAHKYALRQLFNIETGDDPDETPSTEHTQASPEANGKPAKPAPMTADESFRRCQDALKNAATMKLLDQYRATYKKREYTPAQMKTLDDLYEANAKRFSQTK